jgi:hypothetical protein
MSFPSSPTAAYKQQFHDAFVAALAQKESRLQGTVIDRGQIDGSSFTINSLGITEMEAVTGRYQDKNPTELDNNTRVVYMADFDRTLVVDGFDIPKLAADPSHKYVGLLTEAANRRKDKSIYRALIDDIIVKTGENSFGTASLPSGQKILAGGTAFTKAKILLARKLFRSNECDQENGEQLFMAYDSNMVAQILADTTLTSADFMAVQMLQEGKVASNWLGFSWIPYEQLDAGAGGATERKTVAWAKSGVHMGTGINVKTTIGENTQKRGHPTEAYGYMSLGAGRQDEKKVITIDFTI